MIKLFSGTPGSGKSFHVADIIYHRLRFKKNFICNFDINLEIVSLKHFSYFKKTIFKSNKNLKYKKIGKFTHITNEKLTVDYLIDYAKNNHVYGKENQCTLIIDECGQMFNPREWDRKDRQKWIDFFQLHRKLGYDVILISQSDRLIDRQIRAFVEYEVKHRKINNYKLFGAILGVFSGGSLFGCITYWYGVREKISFEMLRFNKRISKIYDTFFIFQK